MKMNAMDWVAMILLIVGGLNWGLVGILDFDLVSTIFGDMTTISRIVYSLVGVAALWTVGKAFMMGGSKPKPAAPATPSM